MLEGWNLESAPEHPWTVQQLVAGQAQAGRRVGMILDLSNHEPLYADEIPAVLEYRHVQLVAKARPLPAQGTLSTDGLRMPVFAWMDYCVSPVVSVTLPVRQNGAEHFSRPD